MPGCEATCGKFTSAKALSSDWQTRRVLFAFSRKGHTAFVETGSDVLPYSSACLYMKESNIDDNFAAISDSGSACLVSVMKRVR